MSKVTSMAKEAISEAEIVAGKVGAKLDFGTDTVLEKIIKSKFSYLYIVGIFFSGFLTGLFI